MLDIFFSLVSSVLLVLGLREYRPRTWALYVLTIVLNFASILISGFVFIPHPGGSRRARAGEAERELSAAAFPAARVRLRHHGDPRLSALLGAAAAGNRLREQVVRQPDEWLLPWNPLERLHKLECGEPRGRRLRAELLEIETRFPDDAPISLGLRYLDEGLGSSVR